MFQTLLSQQQALLHGHASKYRIARTISQTCVKEKAKKIQFPMRLGNVGCAVRNLRLSRHLHNAGFPCYHFISLNAYKFYFICKNFEK